MRKNAIFGLLVILLAFGFIGCDKNENAPTNSNLIIKADENDTLFSSVGSFAGKTTFSYNSKKWWVVASMRYTWSDIGNEWDDVKFHNGTPGEADYHTRIGYKMPDEAKDYLNFIITYDMIKIGGNNTELLIRNSSSGVGGTDANLTPPYFQIDEGYNKSFTLPISGFFDNPTEGTEDGWIVISKGSYSADPEVEIFAGTMLLRIIKIEFTK